MTNVVRGLLLALVLCAAHPARALDLLGTPGDWRALPSQGIDEAIVPAPDGSRALCVAIDYKGGAGYAQLTRTVDLPLPGDYVFTLAVRGELPPNDLEFKLADASGENVWWSVRRRFGFDKAAQAVRIRRRHVAFAWGPAGGGTLAHAASVTLAITAGSGGKGTVCFDAIDFAPRTPEPERAPVASASSSAPGHGPAAALNGTAWRADPALATPQWLAVDFGGLHEFGGLTVSWDDPRRPRSCDVDLSSDGTHWQPARRVARTGPGELVVVLPDAEARAVRLAFPPGPAAVKRLVVEPLAFSAGGDNDVYAALARRAPRGQYPRAFAGEQPYWTTVGVDGGGAEVALFSEDGALEPRAGRFSLEPFLDADGTLASWADATVTHALDDGSLPIPTATWTLPGLTLDTTAFASGEPGKTTHWVQYRVTNRGAAPRKVRLAVALRPLQVNPPAQFLNLPGGAGRVRHVAWVGGRALEADGTRVVPLEGTHAVAAVGFDEGDIVGWLRRGALPWLKSADDPDGRASAAMVFALDLPAGGSHDVRLVIPPDAGPVSLAAASFEQALAATRAAWRERLGRTSFIVPRAQRAVADTARTALAHILLARDRAALHPGTRAYARAWIRDGAMTAAALLRLGHADAAREFVQWFAGYRFPDGKVPCCVDARGADPVPENDADGELIFGAAEVWRFTRDRAFLEAIRPAVDAAAGHIDALRAQRRTEAYRDGPFFGLLPESISHEGYSAKPMHSYWDDAWGVRGLRDAALLARAAGDEGAAAARSRAAAEFGADLAASIRRVMAQHKVDYVPGCAELGDFDATSTTVMLDPAAIDDLLPRDALERTFARYVAEAAKRRDPAPSWDVYTPYEWRSVGALARLGRRDAVGPLIESFFADRRPAAWNQWGEVVTRAWRTPRFLGDMPHGWVASDFLRSLIALFAHARAADGALVLGAGIPDTWLASGEPVGVRGLRLPEGTLSYSITRGAEGTRVAIEAGIGVPPEGVRLALPARRATVNGAPAEIGKDGTIVVRRLPAQIEIE